MQGVRFCCRDGQGKEEVTANCNKVDLGLLILKSRCWYGFFRYIISSYQQGENIEF